jgi:hypothetical protein
MPHFNTKGLARRLNQRFAYLIEERFTLYTKYTDLTIDCSDLSPEDVYALRIEELKRGKQLLVFESSAILLNENSIILNIPI